MRILFLLLLAAAASATAAAAQGNDCLNYVKMPAVGRWAEYQATMNKKDPYTIRYAVVGTEAREGQDMKWMELRMVGAQPDKTTIYQVLTPGTPAQMDQAQEVVIKMGPKPAMKLPPAMLGMLKGQMGKDSPLGNLCEGVSIAGKESVTVPAGTFQAVRYHHAEHKTDSWVVADLPFGVVKAQGEKFEMSLTSIGDGAKSSLTEKPQDMPGLAPK